MITITYEMLNDECLTICPYGMHGDKPAMVGSNLCTRSCPYGPQVITSYSASVTGTFNLVCNHPSSKMVYPEILYPAIL